MSLDKRPPVRIRFRYNRDTGDIEEFIIDDNAPAASEGYHDKIARLISSRLARSPEIEDAGPLRLDESRPCVDDTASLDQNRVEETFGSKQEE